jgi:hypothetical protein
MVSHMLRRMGVSYYDLQNVTSHRVRMDDLIAEPPKNTLRSYERNLRMLHAMVTSSGGKMILAPMAYDRTSLEIYEKKGIEENNQIMRNIAQELNIPLAESDTFLQLHPEWFYDIVHLKTNGNYLKAQLYAFTILQTLGLISNTDEPFNHVSKKSPQQILEEGRDLELQWDFDPKLVREFQIHVQIDQEQEFRYMGRTDSSENQTFRWKANSPELVPNLKEEFQKGPQWGHYYYFKVEAISKVDPSQVIGHLTSNSEVKVLERFHF